MLFCLILAWRDEAEGTSRVGGVLKAILNVEQGDGLQGAVVLWGAALSWLQRLERNKDAVWEFRLLLVRQDVTSGLLELHSTPWSSCQPLFPDDSRCKEFYNTVRSQRTASSFEIDLSTLLSQKYSELETDENSIYRPCYPCLCLYIYFLNMTCLCRPVVLTVRAGDDQICVQVPPALVQRILLNTPPDKLHKTIAPASEVRCIQVVANRISSILTPMKNPFLLTVRSHFQCDDNSIPVIQNFLILDFSSCSSVIYHV
uniref:Shieldin complex subunit 2 n=1 Tax=Sinocyclocheilus grahami TaxID=75366 RepID=A0A672SJJ5_SINGR